MYFLLNWEIAAPLENYYDLTQGNEVIQIYIQDLNGCGPIRHYAFPITEAGQSFTSLTVNLLFQTGKCSRKPVDITVSIRILRGHGERLIYSSDFTLLAPSYTNGSIRRVPIYRLWQYEDYYNMMLANLLTYR